MTRSSSNLPPIGAILSGPHWPDRVRVVRVEPRGTGRVLIQAVTLDGQDRLFFRLLRREDLDSLQVELESDRPTLDGAPAGFRLAAEATRIRLAYTYDPQLAVSVARIDPCLINSKPSITTCCASRACVSCWPTTPARVRPSWPACYSRS